MTTPEPTARELIAALLREGLNKTDIAQGILRRDSGILTPIIRGQKPGRPFVAALSDGLAEVKRRKAAGMPVDRASLASATQEPTRRTDKAGKAIRVRKGTIDGGTWLTVPAQKQAARRGAKGMLTQLRLAMQRGHTAVAFTVSFSQKIRVHGKSGGKRDRRRSVVNQTEFSPDESLPAFVARVDTRHAGNLTEAICYALERRGLISHTSISAGLSDIAGEVLHIEARTWS